MKDKKLILKYFLVISAIQCILGLLDGFKLLPHVVYDSPSLNGTRQAISFLLYPGYMVFKDTSLFNFISIILFLVFNAVTCIFILTPVFLLIKFTYNLAFQNNKDKAK